MGTFSGSHGIYIVNNGINFICLHFVAGNLYHIPVCFWLSQEHPYLAPLVQVKPTQTMSLKVGNNINDAGMVTLPYLNEWNKVYNRAVDFPIDLFHNQIQSEANDEIPGTARNLHYTTMLQIHVQNYFMRCREQCTLLGFRSTSNKGKWCFRMHFKRTDVIVKMAY